MKRRTWIGSACLSVALSMMSSTAWTAPQAQLNSQPLSMRPQRSPEDELHAFLAALRASYRSVPVDQAETYTYAEYSAYQAAVVDQNAEKELNLLDAFVAKYPSSILLPFVYRDYYAAYMALDNYPQAISYADKLLILGDKINTGTRLEALVTRAQAYNADSADEVLQTVEARAMALDTATQGLQILGQLQKPPNTTDEQFGTVKETLGNLFTSVIAKSK